MRFRGPVWVWAAAALACLATDVRAAISVGPSGTETLTFDTWPAAGDISEKSIVGAAGTFMDAASVDASVQTNSAAQITNRLEVNAGNPPSNDGNGRWSSSGLYIQTRPAGVACSLVMATFQNNTGTNIASTMNLSYTLNVVAPNSGDPVGHLVYYSLVGAESSWIQIPQISNQPEDNIAGTYVRGATIDFSFMPWAAGSLLYVLWADDDGPGGADTARQIDDLLLTFDDLPVTIDRDPLDATVEECHPALLSVEARGIPPLTYRWYHNGNLVDPMANPTAATAWLLITNARPADAGSYVARVTAESGRFAESNPAILTVSPDNQGPMMVYALGLRDSTTIIITFDEPVNDEAGELLNYTLCNVGAVDDCWLIESAALSADRLSVTLTSSPRVTSKMYEIRATTLGDLCNGNVIAPDSRLLLNQEIILLTADAVTQWKYNHDGVALFPIWSADNYDDSGWSNGFAALGVEDAPPTDPPLRTTLSLTNANFPLASRPIPTYYFRARFELPGNPRARLKIRTAFDDYGYVYINGLEVYRHPELGGGSGLPFDSYCGGPEIGNYAWGPYTYVYPFRIYSRDNVIAVQLKQHFGDRSDIAMALELVAELPFAQPPSLCAFRHVTGDGSGQLRIVWPCPDPAVITGYVLQSADDLAGPWMTVTNARSPYVVATGAARQFYRLYQP